MKVTFWLIYLWTSSGNMTPVTPWEFQSQEECQAKLVSLVDSKKITPPGPGMSFICWPSPHYPENANSSIP